MKEFNDLLKDIGLTRKEFAEMIGITYKSMGVMLSSGNVPKWVTSALIVARKLKDQSSDDYDRDEEGNLLSCCGDILDEDIMICPTCKEHN